MEDSLKNINNKEYQDEKETTPNYEDDIDSFSTLQLLRQTSELLKDEKIDQAERAFIKKKLFKNDRDIQTLFKNYSNTFNFNDFKNNLEISINNYIDQKRKEYSNKTYEDEKDSDSEIFFPINDSIDIDVEKLLSHHLIAPSFLNDPNLKSEISRSHHITLEQCQKLQMIEIEALSLIFGEELELNDESAIPRCLLITVTLIDCQFYVDISLYLSQLYPLLEPVRVSVFISKPSISHLHDEVSDFLNQKAISRLGTASIFEIVQNTKEWMMNSPQNVPLSSKDKEILQINKRLFLSLNKGMEICISSPGYIYNFQKKEILKFQQQTQVNRATSRSFLRSHLWQTEKAIQSFYEQPNKKSQISFLTKSEIECPICFEVTSKIVGVGCGHWFCEDCFVSNLNVQIKHQGNYYIHCPGKNCKKYVDDCMIQALTSNESYRLYCNWLCNSYISLSRWKYCPNPKCGRLITTENEFPSNINVGVGCICGYNWCFICSENLHWPLNCKQYKDFYLKIIQFQNNETNVYLEEKIKDFVEVSTIECPKCHHNYEKISGCNYVSCLLCGTSFCFSCGKQWVKIHKDHYECPFPKKKMAKNIFTSNIWDNHKGVEVSYQQYSIIIQYFEDKANQKHFLYILYHPEIIESLSLYTSLSQSLLKKALHYLYEFCSIQSFFLQFLYLNGENKDIKDFQENFLIQQMFANALQSLFPKSHPKAKSSIPFHESSIRSYIKNARTKLNDLIILYKSLYCI